MNDAIDLAGGFAARTEDDWRAAVARSGGRTDDLAGRSDDGIPVGPIYRRNSTASPVPRSAAGKPWRIVQRVDHGDAATALAACQQEIGGGATGVALVFTESIHPLGSTLPSSAARNLAKALAVSLPRAPTS